MIDAYIAEATQHTDYADKYGMTYEVAEQALAGTIPEYWFLDDGKYAGCIGVSDVEGFGMTTFHELEAKRAELGLPIELQFDCPTSTSSRTPTPRRSWACASSRAAPRRPSRRARASCCARGGFEFNEELKNTYLSIYPFKFEGWQCNTGDGIRMVEEVGAKLWHMNMVISTTAMWTRDPEYDFAIFARPQSDAFFTVNRLGKRFQNESKTGGTAHNGWHTLMSFDDSIDDYDRIPSWQIFDQKGIDGGPMGTQQGGWFECGNYTTDLPDEIRAMGRLVRRQPGGDRARLGAQGRHAGRPRPRRSRSSTTGWTTTTSRPPSTSTRLLRCRQGRALRPRAHGRETSSPRPARTTPSPSIPAPAPRWAARRRTRTPQVLDPAGNVIPRLYAAGSFGNFQAHSYGITGGNNSENMVWGRIAGRHCAQLESWDAE